MDENNISGSKQFHLRSGILVGIFALCLGLFVAVLYDAQVVNHDAYLARSSTQVTASETVEASRGIITDRNGKVLVSNRESYTITIDTDLIEAAEGESHDEAVARTVLRLIRQCQASGVEWTDTLPLSRTEPFVYTTASASSSQRSRLQRYLSENGWSDSEITAEAPYPSMSASLQAQLGAVNSQLTPQTLMDLMWADFGLEDADLGCTEEEARLVLGVLYELELRRLVGNGFYVAPYVFTEDVTVDFISLLNDGGFDGVVVETRSVRQYDTDYAAHILGRTGAIQSAEELNALNADWQAVRDAGEDTSAYHQYDMEDTVGRDGVEQAFESYLRGKDGTRLITTDEEGKTTGELYSIQPEPGGTVALTIDIDFQAQVEEILARRVEEMNAEDGLETRGAGAVVLSVEDSSVLALASYPNYSQRTYAEDLEALYADPAMPFFNRVTGGTYAPGSTFKPLTAVAALEEGIITPTSIINATGEWRYPGSPNDVARCWIYRSYGGRHGRINVSQAITESCNYFFAEMGYQLGLDTLNEYIAAFGLGQPTGIELGESLGTAPEGEVGQDLAPWAGFGQADMLFTPLQTANYLATLLRGGTRYDVHLLDTVTAYDGSEVLHRHESQVLSEFTISDETLAAVKKGMGDLVTRGSISRYFTDCIVSAGAKTGSAQTGEELANGLFICFAPFDDPEIAVAIVIERADAGSALSSTAVEILNAYFAPGDVGIALVPEGTLLP